MKKFRKFLAILCAISIVASLGAVVSAADVKDATIDTTKTGSFEVYKYDFTSAEKDGVWNQNSYSSTGVRDTNVEATLGTASDSTNYSGNGYAIKGVEFTYLKVADIRTYTEVENGSNKVIVLYGIENTKGAALLAALGLTADDRYQNADFDTQNAVDGVSYFESNVLVNALRTALAADATAVKNALEAYVTVNGGTAMAETDIDGHTSASDLPLGLYLVVETRVPENVTNTTNPFFVSVPMTSVNGTNATNGGAEWIYDITLYPKNETGIPSLEKTVRESKADTGKNNASSVITDGYAHTATGSEGDIMEYQLVSTLPSITSNATALTTFTFVDSLSKGLEYVGNLADGDADKAADVKIEFFSDADCTDLVTTWKQDDAEAKFAVAYGTGDDNATTMTVSMTAAGLKEINEGTYAGAITRGETVRRGYSDLTMRVTYAAKINSTTDTVLGDSGNPNTVTLTWARTNTAYYDVLVDDAHVYTYGVDLTKLFQDAEGNMVDGDYSKVSFVLWNDTDKYWVKVTFDAAEGVYRVVDHTDGAADYETEIANPVYTADNIMKPMSADPNKAKIVIEGLEDDAYILTELTTDNGYTLLKDNIDIVISTAETADSCSIYADQAAAGIHNLIQNDPRFNADSVVGTMDDALMLGWLNNIPQKQLEHKLLTASATVDTNEVTMLNDGNSAHAFAPLQVVNTVGFDLPQTGSTGTWMLTIVGILGMGMAAALIVIASKRKKEEEA